MAAQWREPEPLPIFWRFFIYGLMGFATEVCFTAGWEFVVNLNFKFPGNTSLWSFFIYGASVLVCEHIKRFLEDRKVPLVLRAVVLTVWAFAWEFCCGLVLKPLGWNSWDYTLFDYNIMGIITLEYTPGWFIGSIVTDQMVIPYTNNLCWRHRDENGSGDAICNGSIKQKNS